MDKINYLNVCEGKIKLVVLNIEENKYLDNEFDFFKKYCIFVGNYFFYWEKLFEEIYKLYLEVEIINILFVYIIECLIKVN